MIQHISRFPLLRSLRPKDLKRIMAFTKMRDFPKGSQIFTKSESADHMFVVLGGRVKIYSQSNTRKRKTFAYLGPGDFFGEMAVLLDHVRSASAQAVADSSLLMIHRRDFHRFLLSDPDVTFQLLKTVSDRLRRADEEIENLLFRNILGRVSKALYDLAGRCGRRFRKGLILDERYTHQELADLVGTTREPLSRALAMLRRADLVGTAEGRIFIPYPKKLESLIRSSSAN